MSGTNIGKDGGGRESAAADRALRVTRMALIRLIGACRSVGTNWRKPRSALLANVERNDFLQAATAARRFDFVARCRPVLA